MARQVVLEIEANAGTAASALEEVQSRIEQVKRGFTEGGEAASDSFNQIGRSAENAISSIKGMERATQRVFPELVENTGQGVQAVDSMTASFNDLERRAQISADELRNFSRVQGRVASTGETMRSSVSASSNNLAFELTQAAQDARYGMAGVANQIPLISEQFTQLTAKSGSTAGAFRQLASTFFGPVGIIAGVTLAAPYLQELFTSMTEGEDDATSLANQLEDTSQAFITLRESSREALEVTGGIASEVLADFEDVVSSLNASIQEFETEQFRRESPLIGGGRTSEQAEQQLQQLKNERDLNQQAVEQIEQKLAQRRIEQRILQRSARVLSQQTDLTTEQVQALQQGEAALTTILQGLREEIVSQERATDLAEQRVEAFESLEGNVGNVITAVEQEAVAAEAALEFFSEQEDGLSAIIGGLESGAFTQEQAASAAQEWVEGLENVREQAELVRQAIRRGLITTQDFTVETPQGPPPAPEAPAPAGVSEDEPISALDQFEAPDHTESIRDSRREFNALQQEIDLRREFEAIQADINDGIIGPLEGSQMKVRNLTQTLNAMRAQGIDPSTKGFQETVDRLESARREAAGLQLAFQAISGISESLGQQLAFTIFGEEQRTEQLRSERRQIQEQLREAQRDGDVEQVRELRKELSTVNDRLEAAATLFGRMNQAIERLGNAGVRILKQLTAQLAAAAAKAAILTALSGPLGIAKSFGQLFTSALLGRASGGPVSGRGGPTADRIPALLSDREFVVQASSAQVAPTALQAMNANTEVASAVESFVRGNVRTFSGGGSPNGRSFASVTARSASAPAERQIHITGEFRQRGTEMRATLDETSMLQRRSGRS